jgi:beta-galactosidase
MRTSFEPARLFLGMVAFAAAGGLLGAVNARAQTSDDAPGRTRHTINEGWQYAPAEAVRTDSAALMRSGYDATMDTAGGPWQSLDVPHTWNTEDAFDDDPGYRRAAGWYRRSLNVPASAAPEEERRRLFLYFEGANQDADVFVNGERAGGHVGGYTAFAVDITEQVRPGGENTVAVRLTNQHDRDIPPLSADFTFYGGIYRDVWLVSTAPQHLAFEKWAASGVYLDTPGVADGEPKVRARARVVNEGRAPRQLTVAHRILDAEGDEVAAVRSEKRVAPGQTVEFAQSSRRLADVNLWSPENPYLYRVVTEVRGSDGQTLDRAESPLGFRWVSASGEGFRLNGEERLIKGTNRHQDYPGYGNALPDRFHERDMRRIDEDGFDFVRLAHYPQDPVVLDAADRRGLMVWEETPIVNRITRSEDFTENSLQMVEEMVRQHYNHPSIVIWGYMNEILLEPPEPRPDGYVADVLELTEQLEARVDSLDGRRLTGTAQSFGKPFNGSGISTVPDVLGMNLYFGWYYRELDNLGDYLDRLHAEHPDTPLFISEYGVGSDERVHAADPQAFDFSMEYQQRFHEADFRQLTERSYMVGGAVWNQFDFGSVLRGDTRVAINQKGLYTYDRQPKETAFFYRAQLKDPAEEPMVRIATRSWTRRAGSRAGDCTQPVTIYSNLDRVALFHNGEPVGTKPLDNATARFNVPFTDGDNALRVRALRNGDVAADDDVTVHYDDRTTFFEDADSDVNEIAVNAGSHYQFIDETGLVWETDRAYEDGSWGYVGPSTARRPNKSWVTLPYIRSTPDDPLFQMARDSLKAYRFDVPDGTYEVELGVTEYDYDEPGKRVFSASANGVSIFDGIDLAARRGRYHALIRKAEVRATGGEGLTIRFEVTAGSPTVSTIRVRRLP